MLTLLNIDEILRRKNNEEGFIGVHNSCRSQIAEALCRVYRKDLISYSAGTETKGSVNQDALIIMREKYNIDMKASISLGDKERDIEAAQKAGVGKNFLFKGCYREIIEKL